jgi:hypothetical protein
VTGPDDREAPVVKRGDPGQPEALGDGRDGGIDDARRKIKVSFHEFGGIMVVSIALSAILFRRRTAA